METEVGTIKLGGTIDSWCGKCKRIMGHTIEAITGNKPARVHCDTCKAQHIYKPYEPGKAVPRKVRERAPNGEPGPQPVNGRASRYKALLKGSNAADAKSYSPKDRYQPGDVLEHPSFGRGVATAVKDGTKVEVLFEGGSKLLVHGR